VIGRRLLPTVTGALARRPRLALVALLAALAPLFIAGAGLRPDNSLSVWFVDDDPALVAYRDFLRTFGNDEAIVIAYEALSGWTPAEAEAQRALATQLRAMGDIAEVIAAGEIPGATPELIASIGLGSADGRTLAMVARVTAREDIDLVRGALLDAVRAAAGETLGAGNRRLRYAGTGVLYEELNRQTLRDTGIFLMLALLLMVTVLRMALGRWGTVGVALAPALVAALASLGPLALAGRPLTMVTAGLPTLVLVIALADAIHMIAHMDEAGALDAGARAWHEVVAERAASVAVPCFYTSLTTAVGFLALMTSKLAVVRDFGAFAAIGMFVAWVVVIVAGTALMVLRGPPSAAPATPESGTPIGARVGALMGALQRHRLSVTLLWVTATVVLALGVTRIRVDTLTIGMLPPDHAVPEDSRWIESRLGNYTPLEFVLRDADADSSEAIAARERWRAAVLARPEVDRVVIAGARATAFVPMMSAAGFDTTSAAIVALASAEMPGTRVEASGYLPLYVRITDYTVRSTITGLGIAFLLVFAILAALMRSARLTLAALPANLFPVLLVFGVMGWFGIPLDIGTATVGAIVLGLAVDDSIHLLVQFQRERAAGFAPQEAMRRTAVISGRAVLLTTAVLALGFGVMITSGSASVASFGLVTTLAVLGALAGDLLLLPLFLVPRRTKDAE
jgi:predicted RND superfamily exporter protein